MADYLTMDQALRRLATSKRISLRDLLTSGGAPLTPGVYALWFGDELLYIGMARVDPKDVKNPRAAGVQGRLRTYLDGRLTSDFAIAAAFRFVVPELTPKQRRELASGALMVKDVSRIAKTWIADHIEFTAASTDTDTAKIVEQTARNRGLTKGGPPTFNPFGIPLS